MKDEKEIFSTDELTIKELKMRHLKERILTHAMKNTEAKKEETGYKMQDTMEEESKPKKTRTEEALFGRYKEVPNVVPDDKAWEKHQGQKTTGVHRTVDEIELKAQKNYDILIKNPVNFIKKEVQKRAIKEKELLELSESSSSESSSSE